jgi:NAD(P)H-flavin reductase
MRSAKGCIEEIYLDGTRAAWLSCPPALIPAPGQYLLASAENDPSAALASPIFQAGPAPAGFIIAPAPQASSQTAWIPGQMLNLRGPFGHGFNLPNSARRIALIDYAGNSARLLALLPFALAQKAAVTLLSDNPPAGLPNLIEISPLAALSEIAAWADFLAIDLPRADLESLLPLLRDQLKHGYAQALIGTPLPCAGVARCGVCSVRTRKGYRLACKDGPVFDLNELRP